MPSDPSGWCCEQHRSALIETIADAWHQADPGWATAPQRRELAGIALDAIRHASATRRRHQPKKFCPQTELHPRNSSTRCPQRREVDEWKTRT